VWEEKKAKKIVTDIGRGWNISQSGLVIKESLLFIERGISKRLVQVLVIGESCHFCPGTVGCVIFSNKDNNWEVEFGEKIASIGSWGVPPLGTLVEIGPDKYGILFQWVRSVQGGGYISNIALMAYKGRTFKKLLFMHTGYYEDMEAKELNIKFIPGNNSDYYDIEIASQVYRFLEGEYKDQTYD
jgi:hypothetical protein